MGLRRLIITSAVLLALAAPASASALQFLSVGNARHEIERRFEREEESAEGGAGYSELANCYRVSSTHVNCYSAEHFSDESCVVFLWRVWETATASELGRHKFTMHTKGYRWSDSCQSEE